MLLGVLYSFFGALPASLSQSSKDLFFEKISNLRFWESDGDILTSFVPTVVRKKEREPKMFRRSVSKTLWRRSLKRTLLYQRFIDLFLKGMRDAMKAALLRCFLVCWNSLDLPNSALFRKIQTNHRFINELVWSVWCHRIAVRMELNAEQNEILVETSCDENTLNVLLEELERNSWL